MTANPSIEALRQALEAVEPCGKWHKSSRCGVFVDESEDWASVSIDVRANRLIAPKVARFVATANPEAIRTLLALVDAQEAEKARVERNRDMWKAQVASQADQIALMRAALTPFARCCDAQEEIAERKEWADNICCFTGLQGPTIGQLRAARAAIDSAMKETK